jgi:hypothetical protein
MRGLLNFHFRPKRHKVPFDIIHGAEYECNRNYKRLQSRTEQKAQLIRRQREQRRNGITRIARSAHRRTFSVLRQVNNDISLLLTTYLDTRYKHVCTYSIIEF